LLKARLQALLISRFRGGKNDRISSVRLHRFREAENVSLRSRRNFAETGLAIARFLEEENSTAIINGRDDPVEN
jgi:hypothetical protein